MNSAKLNEALSEAMTIDGAIGVALVDYENGMTLGTQGGEGFDLEIAAAGSTEVVRYKMKVMSQLGLKDRIEDMLISLNTQYHLIRMIKGSDSLFLYLALNKETSNLGMAKYQLSAIDKKLS